MSLKLVLASFTALSHSSTRVIFFALSDKNIPMVPTPPYASRIFELSGIKDKIVHIEGDIRDLKLLKQVFERRKPEIVFHLAAQPLVGESYKNPVNTFETNVMGTVNVLECCRFI